MTNGGLSFGPRSYNSVTIFSITIDELVRVRRVRVGVLPEGVTIVLDICVGVQLLRYVGSDSPHF